MQNLSDNELDKLFQSAAEQFNAPGAGDGWRAMEKKLEAASAKVPWWKLTVWKGAVLTGAVVVSSVSVWLMSGEEIPAPSDAVVSNPVASIPVPLTTNDPVSHSSGERKTMLPDAQPQQKGARINAANNKSSVPVVETPSAVNTTDYEKVSIETVNKPSISNQATVGAGEGARQTESKVPVRSSSEIKTQSLQSQDIPSFVNPSTSQKSSGENTAVANPSSSPVLVVPDSAVQKINQIKETNEIQPEGETINEERDQPTVASPWSIKISASPDFSTVKVNGPYGSGSNYAVQVQYQLTERLSLSTGAIWSKKIYSANNVEYSTPNGNVYTADRASGDCDIIDIPINISYRLHSGRFNWYGSAGLSSYIMLKEKYVYEYEDTYGGITQFRTEVARENNEWAKVFNASVVLEKPISSSWAIQLEPFVKVPLRGVGEGKIRLATLGTFVSIRYSFKRPK